MSTAHLRRPPPSIATLLSRCRSLRHLQQLHSLLLKKSLFPQPQQPLLLSSFLSVSLSFSSPFPSSYSLSLLSSLPYPTPLLFFNSLLSSLTHLPSSLAVFKLLLSLSADPPDSFTFPPLLRLSSRHMAVQTGTNLHALSIHLGLDLDLFVRTALIDFYGRSLMVDSARNLFDTMSQPNTVSWTALIAGYLRIKDLKSAQQLFDKMPERNSVTYSVMIDGCIKNGDLQSAQQLFDKMPEKNKVSCTCLIHGFAKSGDLTSAKLYFDKLTYQEKDIFTWSVMISGYAQNGQPHDALNLIHEFHKLNIKPDACIIVGLMSACSQIGSLTLAKWIDSYISSKSIDIKNPRVLTTLIDMHAKCGNITRAQQLFDEMPQRDIISYCSMMQGYCLNGSGSKAVSLFSQMLLEGLNPDPICFTVVLTACTNSRLVEQGKKYFHMMEHKYNIIPSNDHYACLVDLLGKSGKITEAFEIIKNLPVEKNEGAWGALLGACRINGNVEIGDFVAKKLFEMEPKNGGNYVSLSNIYANADRWGEVSRVRSVMSEKGVRKVPGCSWVLP
ncbi:hypothetical protein LUZ60_004164 [Juncus effusus]|nr:hypothetical protein LUZ60_004164 [Juncus effusus]